MSTTTLKEPENPPSNRPDCSDSLEVGVWFKAACSGLWYRDFKAAGSVVVVRIDGDDFLPMPYQLTAENGAKGRLIGGFKESIEIANPEYCGCGECDYCLEVADEDDGPTMLVEVPVSWTTIKEIYKVAVSWFLRERFEIDQ